MRKALGARPRGSDHWWYGNCLYDDAKFTGYILKHEGGNWWSLVLPDGTGTPHGTRFEAMEVAISLASGMRPSSNRVYPGK